MSRTQELAEHVTAWHSHIVEQLSVVIDAPKGMKICLGEESGIELTEEQAKGFYAGVVWARSLIDPLPFTVDGSEEQEEEQDA